MPLPLLTGAPGLLGQGTRDLIQPDFSLKPASLSVVTLGVRTSSCGSGAIQ